jgi:acetyltransferase
MRQLSAAQAEFLASVDYKERMALVASRLRDGTEEIIAVARYGALGSAEPGRAEFAIAVEDAYQGQRLGQTLMQQLVTYARHQGFHTLIGTIAATNTRMLHFVQRLGLPCRTIGLGRGEIQVELTTLLPSP